MGYMGYEAYWVQAEAPHLIALTPTQSVASEYDFSVLFANSAWTGEDNVVPLT